MKVSDIIDPRQLKCLALYRNPTSATFGNLKQSAISAGFDDHYANVLTVKNPAWLSASAQADVKRVLKAENSIDKVLNVNIKFDTKNNIDVAKLQIEVSKFILKTVARQKYSEQQEDTPPNVQINIVNYNEIKDAQVVDAQVVDAQVVDAQR